MGDARKKRGAPSRYNEKLHVKWACSLARRGCSNVEIAEAFEISPRTFQYWCKKHPELLQALKASKSQADAEIADSLYLKAIGKAKRTTVHKRTRQDKDGKVIETIVEKSEETPLPDTTAMIFWLKNRQPELWRDRPKQDDTDTAVLKAAKELVSGVKSAIG